MGRIKPSAGLPPAAFRKDARAKKAKATINKTIPSLLSGHPRARNGIVSTELLTPDTLPRLTPLSHPSTTSPPRISLRTIATLSAAHSLLAAEKGTADLGNRTTRVALLNMASPLSPGGGFLNGASSQEEYLCMRTTLLPALRDEFYRLPELSAIFTPDVLVFRDEEGEDLPKRERWFVDVVSAAMLRQTEVEGDRYVNDKDRDMVRDKLRFLMRVLGAKGARKVVLGAWGCGAYGNPVGEVARAWKAVLMREKREGWDGIEDIVFAIKEKGMAEKFTEAFGEGLVVEEGDEVIEEEDDDDLEGEEIRALEEKIREMDLAVEQARSTQLKSGLARAVAGLKKQLDAKMNEGGASGELV